MVVSTPTPKAINIKRSPLIPSEPDKNNNNNNNNNKGGPVPRRPKSRDINSRYLSSTSTSSYSSVSSSTTTSVATSTSFSSSSTRTTSSSNNNNNSLCTPIRRSPSPYLMTPATHNNIIKRAQSTERRRPVVTTASKMLTGRSLSASFQGPSVSSSKGVKAAGTAGVGLSNNNNGSRNGTPERRVRKNLIPVVPNTVDYQRIDQKRWPARSRPQGSFMTRSVDFSNENVKLSGSGNGNGNGTGIGTGTGTVVRSLEKSMMNGERGVRGDNKVFSDSDNNSDVESVSSGSSLGKVGGVKAGSRVVVVPARYMQESVNRLRRVQPEPVSPPFLKNNKMVSGSRYLKDGAVQSPRGLSPSPVRGPVRPASPGVRAIRPASPVKGAVRPASPAVGGVRPASPVVRGVRPASPAVGAVRPGSPAVRAIRPASPAVGAVRPASPAVRTVRPASPAVGAVRPASPARGAFRPASPSKSVVSASASSTSRGMASPTRARNAIGSISNLGNTHSILSFAAETRRKAGDKAVSDAHALRLLHNKYLQWRFANARADAAMSVQSATAQKSLYNSWVTTTKMRQSVISKQLEIQQLRQNLKLYTVLKNEIPYLKVWDQIERDHIASLSGTTVSLESSTLRVPLVDGAKEDVQSLKDAIRSANDVMRSMASVVRPFLTKVEHVNSLVSELASTTTNEQSTIDECKDLLSKLTRMEVQERSLRTDIIQRQHPPTTLTEL